MGIFTGPEVLFFFIGILSAVLAVGLIRLGKGVSARWKIMPPAILGALLTLFTVGWSGSSVLEGEPQAAVMGVLFFGLPVFVIFGITRRLVKGERRPLATQDAID